MSKARRWVIIVLSLAVLVMIGINMAEKRRYRPGGRQQQ
ncbi:putative organic solvent tolerance protein [Escherichia coli]|uniref:Putative organic solvent tolerance protein n=1 Tax=Escherichia coli TaxID=562 RepID=A0A377A6E1_ECOLX|nr:putative organic solvent tolerance protein [Escherichia coli]